MKNMTAQEALETIQRHVAEPEVRTMQKLEIGQRIHQGDVYLTRVAADWPRGELLGTRQVAVGTTQGSRHIVEGDADVYAGVQLPSDCTPNQVIGAAAYLGPVVVVGDEQATLTHPEHAHHPLECGTFQVTYQVDMQTQQRVAD